MTKKKKKQNTDETPVKAKLIERSGLKWKPDQATLERPSATSLDVVMDQVRQKYGKGVVVIASEAEAAVPTRISSGVFLMDYALGGGWPRGKIALVYGPPSSGKSSLLLKTIAQCHRTCRNCGKMSFQAKEPYFVDKKTGEMEKTSAKGKKDPEPPKGKELKWLPTGDPVCPCDSFEPLNVVWVDLERSYDRVWAEALGVRNDLVWLIEPESAEMAMDISDAVLRTGEIDVLVVDSIAMMTPKKEIESSLDDDHVAILARKVNRWLRKLGSAQSAQGGLRNAFAPTVFLINQVRASIGLYGPKEVLPGGKAQKFARAVEVRLRQGQWRKHQRKKIQHYPAMETVFRVNANKTAVPRREGIYTMWLMEWNDGGKYRRKGETEEIDDVLQYAFHFDVIIKENGTLSVLGESFGNEDELYAWLQDNEESFWALRNLTIRAMG